MLINSLVYTVAMGIIWDRFSWKCWSAFCPPEATFSGQEKWHNSQPNLMSTTRLQAKTCSFPVVMIVAHCTDIVRVQKPIHYTTWKKTPTKAPHSACSGKEVDFLCESKSATIRGNPRESLPDEWQGNARWLVGLWDKETNHWRIQGGGRVPGVQILSFSCSFWRKIGK